ncbi:hypothetical protein [Schleiferilactobacillus harbinensis]|uniref:hypothetical protein n=1 Tax=Schleiferilactobacillus harbinensis TaxID=304207 RepID=UPI0039E9D3A0
MDDNSTSHGMGLIGVITVTLIILKLFGLINIGWLAVFVPLLICWALACLVTGAVCLYYAIKLKQ